MKTKYRIRYLIGLIFDEVEKYRYLMVFDHISTLEALDHIFELTLWISLASNFQRIGLSQRKRLSQQMSQSGSDGLFYALCASPTNPPLSAGIPCCAASPAAGYNLSFHRNHLLSLAISAAELL